MIWPTKYLVREERNVFYSLSPKPFGLAYTIGKKFSNFNNIYFTVCFVLEEAEIYQLVDYYCYHIRTRYIYSDLLPRKFEIQLCYNGCPQYTSFIILEHLELELYNGLCFLQKIIATEKSIFVYF